MVDGSVKNHFDNPNELLAISSAHNERETMLVTFLTSWTRRSIGKTYWPGPDVDTGILSPLSSGTIAATAPSLHSGDYTMEGSNAFEIQDQTKTERGDFFDQICESLDEAYVNS